MNPIQTKLEQIYKEYLSFKNIVEEDDKTIDDLRKELGAKALELDTVEQQAELSFNMVGEKLVFRAEFLEEKKKLYYFVQAFKDFIEIPEEILKEIEDYKVKAVFAVIGGEKKIIDKELYASYKTQSIEYAKQFSKN